MRRAIWRSLGVGALTFVAYEAVLFFSAVELCQYQRATVRVRSGQSDVVLASGFGIARPGDAIFVCETTHTFATIPLHKELQCFCAPQTTTADIVASLVEGSCVVDKPAPKPNDDFGACRFAHCSVHLDP